MRLSPCTQVLATRKKLLGSGHTDTAHLLQHLGDVYCFMGKRDEAGTQYKLALEIRKKALELEHLGTASSLNSLASMYAAEGKYDEAELGDLREAVSGESLRWLMK